jgi:hypothetical protein
MPRKIAKNDSDNSGEAQKNLLESAKIAFLTQTDVKVDDNNKIIEDKPEIVDEVKENNDKSSLENLNPIKIEAKKQGKDSEPEIDNEETDEPKYTKVELQAMDEGWVPKDKFLGDKDKWRDAASWLHNSETHRRIDNLTSENKSIKKMFAEFIELFKEDKKIAIDNQINQLKTARIEAIKSGNVEEVEQIEKKIAEFNGKSEKVTPKPTNNTPEEVESFVSRNSSWFIDPRKKTQTTTHPEADEMTAYAKAREIKIAKQYTDPDNHIEDILLQVEKDTLKRFGIQQEVKNMMTAEPRRTSVNRESNYPSFDSLPSDVKGVISAWVQKIEHRYKNRTDKTNMLTKEKYIKQLVDSKVMDRKGNFLK